MSSETTTPSSPMVFLSSTAQPASLSLFPMSYGQARELFQHDADQAECQLTSWTVAGRGPKGETLAIDVARYGPAELKKWLIITSGLHGTEGPFGSAVQRGFLRTLLRSRVDDVGVLFLHAVNPFGYAWVRRANEENIDLNRNFLLPGDAFQGAHPLYRYVYETFDPHRPPRFYESFYLRAGWLIARHSKAALQTSLPIGQYDYPKGLFFGGQGPSETQRLFLQHLPGLIPQADSIVHLDFHTGLGRWAGHRLLIDAQPEHADAAWFRTWAAPGTVETAALGRTAYHARGSIGPWFKTVLFPDVTYRYAAAEFGTYGSVRVLHSLVQELRAHYAFEPDHPHHRKAKRLVQETFVPRSPRWRSKVLKEGIELCQNCVKKLSKAIAD